jgi:hypothetical protein
VGESPPHPKATNAKARAETTNLVRTGEESMGRSPVLDDRHDP